MSETYYTQCDPIKTGISVFYPPQRDCKGKMKGGIG